MDYLTRFLFIIVLAAFFATACDSANEDPHQHIVLKNMSDVALKDKPISIARNSITLAEEEGFSIPIVVGADTIPSQLDDRDGDGQWDELFFVVDLEPGKEVTFDLLWTNETIAYPKKTNVRFGKRDSDSTAVYSKQSDTLFPEQIHAKLGYQPFQTDGPTFENDMIGFRHYFDGRNAKDLYGKIPGYMTPDTVGINANGDVSDNYHQMAYWGRDVLSVGNSSGVGGVALQIGDEYGRLGCISSDTITNIDLSSFEIVRQGPVRSIMRFTHKGWHPIEGRDYTLTEEVSIWPGMYAFRGETTVKGLQGDEQLLVGLVNSNTEEDVTELVTNDTYTILYTHDKQTYDKTWWLGLAIIVPKTSYQGYGEAPEEGSYATNYYAKMKIEENKPMEYYGLGAWELSDTQFTDSTYFVEFIQNFADQVTADVVIDVN